MRKILYLLILAFVFVTNSNAQTRVACIGNSITYGHGIEDRVHDTYPAQLQKLLGDRFDVQNFGVSGTTAQTSGDFAWKSTPEYQKAKDFQPQICVIKLGTNDSKPQNWKDAKRFAKEFESLVKEFQNLPTKPRIIIALPAKAYNHSWDISDEVITGQIIPAIEKVCKKNKWQLIDLHSATSGISALFPDGIHPGVLGAGLIARNVAQAIQK